MYDRLTLPGDLLSPRQKKLLLGIDMTFATYAKHVKHLCFRVESSVSDAFRLLPLCKRIDYLACWIEHPMSWLFEVVTTHKPKRVSLRLSFDGRLNLSHPFFDDVTHLEFVALPSVLPLVECDSLPSINNTPALRQPSRNPTYRCLCALFSPVQWSSNLRINTSH